ncbi:malonyl-ACP O-methyltransferase BioC [Dechloromonas sp. ARDL1]|uniref:malonyl-ACP O-methyltransferase BioC n=1 Tax=Dechloromonas sp. ARDL1 TaxID=3322121 RepID=UPI003DA76EE9
MTKPSKARVRQSFERAAGTYDNAAAVQRRICHDLSDRLPPHTVQRLLDAGCGTGYALPLLRQRFPQAHVVGLDLSPAMLSRVPEPCCRVAADLEHLPLADACLDLFWSSLAVQWCDLPATLHEARRILKPGGTLALASLGPATFHELRQAFAGVDDYRHTLPFHGVDDIHRMAADVGLQGIAIDQYPQLACYADFKSLLRAVKAIGANQVGSGRRTSLMSRSAFQKAEAAYEMQRTPNGLPLTYDVITLIAHA